MLVITRKNINPKGDDVDYYVNKIFWNYDFIHRIAYIYS